MDNAVISSLPQEQQDAIYKTLTDTITTQRFELEQAKKNHDESIAKVKAELEATIATLKQESESKDIVIISLKSLGIDETKIPTFDKIAPYLSLSAEMMDWALKKNKKEYLRMVLHQRQTLISEKFTKFKDAHLDYNGTPLNEKMNEIEKFFDEYGTTDNFVKGGPKAVKRYDEIARLYKILYNDMITWKMIHADVSNVNEASTDAMIKYAILEAKDVDDNKDDKVAINPIAEMAKEKLQTEQVNAGIVLHEQERIRAETVDRRLTGIEALLEKAVDFFTKDDPVALDKGNIDTTTDGEGSEDDDDEHGANKKPKKK